MSGESGGYLTSFLPSIKVLFTSVQNLKVGGRISKSTFQYTVQAVTPCSVENRADKLVAELGKSPVFVGLNTDAERNGLGTALKSTATRRPSSGSIWPTCATRYSARKPRLHPPPAHDVRWRAHQRDRPA